MSIDIKEFLIEKDPELAKIISKISESKILSSNDIFYDLVSCILDQQIHYRGKKIKMKKLHTLINNEPIKPKIIIKNSDLLFSELKISKNKFDTLMRVSEYWETQNMAAKEWSLLNDKDIKSLLMDVKGIGNWTADMILLFTLNRPNIFPFEDYHLKKIMQSVYNLEDNKHLKTDMLDIASYWNPYASLAVKYLLHWKTYLNSIKHND